MVRTRNPFPTRLACLTVGCAVVAGCLAPGGREPSLIAIEDLFSSPTAAAAQVSPDGSRVAYLKPFRGKMNVYVRTVDDGDDRLVTADTTRPIEQFEWSADGRRILYLQDNGGDEGFHLFAVDAAPTGAPVARDLTPYSGIEVELLSVPPATPGTVLITMNQRDPALADAYRLNLDTGALDLAATNPGTVLGYVADSANQIRVAYALDSLGRYHLLWRTTERAAWKELAVYPVEDRVTPLRFHPDGQRIYLLSNHGSDLLRLVLFDPASGRETVVEEDPLGKVDLDGVAFDGAGTLVAARYLGDTLRWYPRADAVRRLQARVVALGRGLADLGAGDLAGRRRVVRVGSPTDPGAEYLDDDEAGTLLPLFESRPWLEGARFASTEPISYRTRDSLVVHGYLTRPPASDGGRVPLLLAVHGGPWSRDVWQFEPETQLYASRGYAVLQVNYRGSTGYGKRFARLAEKAFGRAMHDDLVDAVRWAVARDIADSTRVAIMGGSYGGYSALVGLTFTPTVFACAVDYAGPSNLVTLLEAFPPSWGPFLPRSWYPFVGDPRVAADRRDMESRSPIFRADSARAPLLIFQGANDPRTTREQSDLIVKALHRRGLPVTYLLASNEGHSFGNRETSLAVTRATEVFLGGCLGGRVQPTVPAEIETTVRALTVNPDSLP